MNEKPTYKELERKSWKLEKEVLAYICKEKEFSEERRLSEYRDRIAELVNDGGG